MIIPVVVGPTYIKKEDAKDFIKSQRRMNATSVFVLAFCSGIFPFIYWILNLGGADVLKTTNPQIPLLYILVVLFLLASVGYLVYVFKTQPNYEMLYKTVSKYKDGEMIKTNEIVVGYKKSNVIAMVFALLMFFVIVFFFMDLFVR